MLSWPIIIFYSISIHRNIASGESFAGVRVSFLAGGCVG